MPASGRPKPDFYRVLFYLFGLTRSSRTLFNVYQSSKPNSSLGEI